MLPWLSGRGAEAVELKINQPSMDAGEIAIEDNSAVTTNGLRPQNARQAHFGELGYGVTDYWWTEIEGNWESGPDGLRLRTVDIENAVRVQEQDDWRPETAIFLEYDQAVARGSADTATIAALLRKDFGPSSTVVNVFLDHDLGPNAQSGVRLRYIGTSTWEIVPPLAPGIEFYGAPGPLSHIAAPSRQDHRLGPVILGHFALGEGSDAEYSVGYLFGLTHTADAGTVVWRLEYDLRF